MADQQNLAMDFTSITLLEVFRKLAMVKLI